MNHTNNNYTDLLVSAPAEDSNRTVSQSQDKALNIMFKAEVMFYRTMLPFICVIGLCGNSMAVLLIRTNFALKRLPSNVYLSALSISSSLFLVTVLLMWTETVSSLKIYHGSWWGCKTLTFVAHFCDFSCIWLILSVCTDRMFLLYWPKWRKKVWNLKAARNTYISSLNHVTQFEKSEDLVEEGLQLMAYALYYGHFAVLFFLYIFWSPQLKKELKPTALKLLECYCFKTVPDFGYEDSAEQRRRQLPGSS